MSTGAQAGSGRRSEQATAERPTQFPQDAAHDQPTQQMTAHPEARPAPAPGAPGVRGGTTRIGEGVVAKIAGLAARDIPGVFSMGSGVARRMGQLRNLIPGSSEAASQGVSVEVGEREAAVDLNLVTWYGQSIVEIAEAVRRNVTGQVEGMTGLHVVEVNVQVDDIHVESPDSSDQSVQRVQ
jgi:uncharacterized alkaline shock family protein YloU